MRDFVKISFQDIEIAEEFFENDKHLNEFLTNVIRYYRGLDVSFKFKIVQKYFKTYMKTMDFVIKASKHGSKGGLKRVDNQVFKEPTLQGSLEGLVEAPIEGVVQPNNNNKNKDKDNSKEEVEVLIYPCFDDFWNLYDKKSGDKKSCVQKNGVNFLNQLEKI